VKIIGFTGWSGSGKTQLIVKLIPLAVARGLSVSTIKHAHHAFDIDRPGKDSHSHRVAGASEVLISSGRRFALIHELRNSEEWTLAQLIGLIAPVDLLFVEGFKRDPHPKIEVFRTDNGKPPLFPENPTIRAIAADCPFPGADQPVYALDDVEKILSAALDLAVPVDAVFPRRM
jgi:molybdopterin-guanine dinucleotide biosynthesis protein B